MGDIVIQSGSEVRLHFRALLANGTLLDDTYPDEPATVRIGCGELLAGLEQRLLGLRAGDRRRFEIPASEAYGPVDLDAIMRLPRADFPPDIALEPGALIAFTTPQGEEVPGTVISATNEEVVVDFSHPLAGHDVIFEVEILAVTPANGPDQGVGS